MGSTEQPRGTPSPDAMTRAANDSFAWSLLQAMPDGVVMVEDGGRIVFANRRAETLFGYARGGLLGEAVEVLVPPDLHDAHREHRARYGDAPAVRPMGAGLRLDGIRRDGTHFALDISLSPLVEGSRRLIVAAIRPHSDAERDRLATALHDSIIHRLFAIGMSPKRRYSPRTSASPTRLGGRRRARSRHRRTPHDPLRSTAPRRHRRRNTKRALMPGPCSPRQSIRSRAERRATERLKMVELRGGVGQVLRGASQARV
jgi:PAS domain S-box-containing protein